MIKLAAHDKNLPSRLGNIKLEFAKKLVRIINTSKEALWKEIVAPAARLLNALMQSNTDYALSIICQTQLPLVIQQLTLSSDSRMQQLGIDVFLAATQDDVCKIKLMQQLPTSFFPDFTDHIFSQLSQQSTSALKDLPEQQSPNSPSSPAELAHEKAEQLIKLSEQVAKFCLSLNHAGTFDDEYTNKFSRADQATIL